MSDVALVSSCRRDPVTINPGPSLNTCPACSAPVDVAATECSSCGVVVAKWRPHQKKATLSRRTPKRSFKNINILPFVAAGSLVLALAVGGYWYYTVGRADDTTNVSYESETGDVLKKVNTRAPGFDVAYELPQWGAPGGAMATDGADLIIGPMRIEPRGDDYFAQKLPDLAQMNLTALTFNGREYIAINGDQFAVLARKTLRFLRSRPAPTSLGCLAWDGESYWAATRIHPALLYRLDGDFNIKSTHDAPAACHGLAWDGQRLWLADGAIHVIDVSGGKPRVVHTEKTSLPNLSGIVAFNRNIWVTDSDRNLLQRLAPPLRDAWTSDGSAPVKIASAVTIAGDNVAALRRQIRSSDWRERVRAKVEMEKLGAAIDFDRHQSRFVERKSNDAEVIDWEIELRDGVVFGSWKLWFGSDLVRRGSTASYTITVIPPQGEAIQKVFDAKPGDNAMDNVSLAPAGVAGEYRVDLNVMDHSPLTLKVAVSPSSAAPQPAAAPPLPQSEQR